MQIKQDEIFHQRVISILNDLNNKDRSEGIHFSDLNYCLRKAFYAHRHPGLNSEKGDQSTLMFALGLSFEYYVTKGKQQEEFCVDGIYVTPDFISEEGEHWEVKVTYLGSNKDVSEQENYIRQMKAYCKIKGVLEFKLVMLHIMGDWSWVWKRKGTKVDYSRPIINPNNTFIFTQEEIEENWETAKLKRDWLLQAIRSGVPPLPIKETWECKYCKWASQGICDQVKAPAKELF